MVEAKASKTQEKIKITVSEKSLSAFACDNFRRALKNVTVQMTEAKPTAGQNEFFNVQLTLGQTSYYGELTIFDILARKQNATTRIEEHLIRQGQGNMAFDDMIHQFNSSLRNSAINALKKNAGNDDVNTFCALLNEHFEQLKNKKWVTVATLVYSYLSALSFVDEKTKSQLNELTEIYNFNNWTSFQAEKIGNLQAAAVGTNANIYQSNAKIKRVSDEKVLPVKGKRNILITSALPYVNNVPHLGNIIGCVLSADVSARYFRQAGHNVVYISGTDEYGTATEKKAKEEKKTCKEICDHYHAIHKGIYDWFDCDFDLFGRTSTEKHTKITQDIFNDIHREERTMEKVTDQQFCLACDTFLADRFVYGTCHYAGCGAAGAKGDQCDACGKLINAPELVDPHCQMCHATPVIRQSEHIYIDLPKMTGQLTEWMAKAEIEGDWSANASQFSNNFLKGGLLERCITRDLKWGTPVPLEKYAHKVFYVWFDAPIGYISITANYCDEWQQWWQNKENVELYQFMGKDNLTFHTVIFPSTLLATGKPWTMLKSISSTEYLNYELDEATGKPKKFSKSNNTGVFGDDAQKTGIPVEVWRYYLLVNRPEQQDTTFLWHDFVAKNNNELLANLGNFSNRALTFLSNTFGGVVPENKMPKREADEAFLASLREIINKYMSQMDQVKQKDGLRSAMEYSQICNGYFQDQEPWKHAKTDMALCGTIMFTGINALYMLCVLLEPFMPSFSAKVYEQLAIKRTIEHETIIGQFRADPAIQLKLVPSGHKIGTVGPIFKEIPVSDADKWKAQFGGRNK